MVRPCRVRDALRVHYEDALDDYIRLADKYLTNPVDRAGVQEAHISLNAIRRKIREHCEKHGCDSEWLNLDTGVG